MATLRRPPFFEIPFPDPTTPWLDLPQAVRDAWANYALGNPIGYLDYQTVQRNARDAYDFTTQMDACAHAGTTAIVYPPDAQTPITGLAAKNLTEATTSDTLAAAANRTITEATGLLLWSTAPAATTAEIDAKNNKFIGFFNVPIGTLRNQFLGNLGADYVTAFGSLAAALGQYIVVWAFQVLNGSITYAGASTVVIKSLPASMTWYYFPLNQATAPFASLAVPAEFQSFNAPLQTDGPIDNAIQLTNVNNQGLSALHAGRAVFTGADFTVNLWLRIDDWDTSGPILQLSHAPEPGETTFRLFLDGALDTLNLELNDTGNWQTFILAAQADYPVDTWKMLTLVFAVGTSECTYYIDGVAQAVLNDVNPEWKEDANLYIGTPNFDATPPSVSVAELITATRQLTADEVTLLYNSGSGLRYPYP